MSYAVQLEWGAIWGPRGLGVTSVAYADLISHMEPQTVLE